MNWLLVLGARSDIARATARLFAKQGFALYLAGRDLPELEKDAADLSLRFEIPARAIGFDALDLDSHQDIYDGLDPRPEGVLCAVGYLGDQKKAQHDPAEARRILETNLNGPVSMLNIVARDLERRGRGFVIGISSVAGDRGRASNQFYGCAKAGFSAYLSGLRNRLAPAGVRVLTVKPGFVKTAMTEGMDLPPLLCATPEQAARDILRAWRKGKDVAYTRWFWKWIMKLIVGIPERIFKRMKL